MPESDVLVVGSGPCGVSAAWPLVEAGARVTLVDGGFAPPPILSEPLELAFGELRRARDDQWRWFLGEDLSGVPVSDPADGRGGGNLSGNRAFVTRAADACLPVRAEGYSVLQTLAIGGLGAAWGGVCALWSADELAAAGLPPDEMAERYRSVCARIGVSGPSGAPGCLPPARLDGHGERIEGAARRRAARRERLGVRVAQPPLALLTEDRGARRACDYGDLEYVSDPRRSVWRPADGLEELSSRANFAHRAGLVVERIEERAGEVRVLARRVEGERLGARQTLGARHVVLAAGAIASARILLASLEVRAPLPMIGKAHWISACLHPATLGRSGPERRTSLCQMLVRCFDPAAESSAQLYSYRSALLARLLHGLPLPVPEALGLLALLVPSIVIADVRFPAHAPNASLRLEGGTLLVHGTPDPGEPERRARAFARLRRALRTLGLLPLTTLRLAEGSAFHYAGTVPHAPAGAFPLTCEPDGRLRGSVRTWIADAAVLRALPPLSHTLTAMANAERIGAAVAAALGT
jgi:choline dehydrogenase-like flavoprotein